MKKIFVILTALIFGTTACNDYLDVNVDPNNPTSVTPDLVLPVAQTYTARWMKIDRGVNHLGNMMMYNWSESAGFSWYNDEFQYRANSPTFYDQLFNQAFTAALKQYEDLKGLGDDYKAYEGIAMIMQAYTFEILVDLYGDIPYEEALLRGGNTTPAYSDAQGVYDALIISLTDAITLLGESEETATSVSPSGDDVMYGGDLNSWKQLANTIKLRILTRESDVKDAAYITTELAAIAAQGSGYITSDVAINPGYLNEEGKQSPFYEDFGMDVAGTTTLTSNATCATDYIIDLLTTTNDPRISRLYEQPVEGHLGVPQGIVADPDTQGPDQVSNIGPALLTNSMQDAVIMTSAEALFNQAELALKGFGGDPEILFTEAVTASFAALGAADADVYLAQSGMENVNYGTSTDKLEAIITQKWIALNGITAEQSWFDWSRTGFPLDLPVSTEIPGLVRPRRLSYPASELGTNGNNVPDQPDVFTTSVFWAN